MVLILTCQNYIALQAPVALTNGFSSVFVKKNMEKINETRKIKTKDLDSGVVVTYPYIFRNENIV